MFKLTLFVALCLAAVVSAKPPGQSMNPMNMMPQLHRAERSLMDIPLDAGRIGIESMQGAGNAFAEGAKGMLGLGTGGMPMPMPGMRR